MRVVTGSERMLFLGLRLASELLNANVPGEVKAAEQADVRSCWPGAGGCSRFIHCETYAQWDVGIFSLSDEGAAAAAR